jgi:hypothetical protein
MKKNLLLMMLCAPAVLAAQNGVTVSNLAADAGTVTFNVSWTAGVVPGGKVWVFVDYNKNGVMERLPVTGATVSPGTAETVIGNDNGAWVNGGNSFSGTVTLSFNPQTAVAGACVYASGYPPEAEYTGEQTIHFTGTPPYDLVLSSGTITVYSDYNLLPGVTLVSFTDKTGAPGTIKCIPSSTYNLVASASGFCEGGAGVTFALSGTQSGRSYELYRDGAPTAVTLTGTENAQTFTASINVPGTYTAKMLASDGYCEATMSGSHTLSKNALPTLPTIDKPNDVCLNGGDIVFTAMGYTGTLEWVSNGSGTESGNSVTFASGAATGTKTVTARSAQTYTNALVCYSAEVTQSVDVLALPDTPTLAVSASTVCLGTNIVFRVTSLVSGATYTWSGAAGTVSGTGDGTYTVSGAATGTKSVTAYARLASNGTTCQSGNASLSAFVSQPGTGGLAADVTCGCAEGTADCSGTCKTTGTYTTNDGACSGACNYAYVQLRDQCGAVTSPRHSTYSNAACFSGCDATYDSACKTGSVSAWSCRQGESCDYGGSSDCRTNCAARAKSTNYKKFGYTTYSDPWTYSCTCHFCN